jgi:hypothetical protein
MLHDAGSPVSGFSEDIVVRKPSLVDKTQIFCSNTAWGPKDAFA